MALKEPKVSKQAAADTTTDITLPIPETRYKKGNLEVPQARVSL